MFRIRYVFYVVFLLILVKSVEMYNNVYPKIEVEYYNSNIQFDFLHEELGYNLLYFQNLSNDLFVPRVKNITYQKNIWNEKELIGQKIEFSCIHEHYNLNFVLSISLYDLPSYIHRTEFRTTDSIIIEGNYIMLMEGDYNNDPTDINYYFKFRKNSTWFQGKIQYTSRDSTTFSSEIEKLEFVKNYLENVLGL